MPCRRTDSGSFVDSSDCLLRLLLQTRIIRIAGAAHAMHIDQPERFADAVRSVGVIRLRAWGGAHSLKRRRVLGAVYSTPPCNRTLLQINGHHEDRP